MSEQQLAPRFDAPCANCSYTYDKHHHAIGLRTCPQAFFKPASVPAPAPDVERLRGGVAMIASERQRQIEQEGWTPEHDAHHEDGELAIAAACYAIPNEQRSYHPEHVVPAPSSPIMWPFDESWWKPCYTDRVRELVKAGALIAAEIDRLLRALPSDSPKPSLPCRIEDGVYGYCCEPTHIKNGEHVESDSPKSPPPIGPHDYTHPADVCDEPGCEHITRRTCEGAAKTEKWLRETLTKRTEQLCKADPKWAAKAWSNLLTTVFSDPDADPPELPASDSPKGGESCCLNGVHTDHPPVAQEVREDSEMCICGHTYGMHNDITSRCCHKVVVGVVDDDLPILRLCDLCPPSGFKLAPVPDCTSAWPTADCSSQFEFATGRPLTLTGEQIERAARIATARMIEADMLPSGWRDVVVATIIRTAIRAAGKEGR